MISSRNLSQDFPITFGLNKETLYTHHVEKLHRTYVGKTLNFCKNIVGIERNGKWGTKFSKLKSFKTFKAYNINHNSKLVYGVICSRYVHYTQCIANSNK